MHALSLALYTVASVVFLWFASKLQRAVVIHRQLSPIPTVGCSGFFSSYISSIKFMRNGRDIIQEGYDLHKDGAFKVPAIDRWMIIVSGKEKLDDIRKAGIDHLSFMEAADDLSQHHHVLGRLVDRYHVAVVRGVMTKNVSARYADVLDEVITAFEDLIPAREDEWTSVPALKNVMRIVARATTRFFLGLPMSRNAEYQNLVVRYTTDIITTSQILLCVPPYLKPLVAPFTPLAKTVRKAVKLLGPIITERYINQKQYGKDWQGKPNDLLTWLIDEAPEEQSVFELTKRILTINFAAIHTTSMAFTHAIYYLASYREIVGPLRAEVQDVLENEPWSKAAIDKMHQLDSFMKEVQRLDGTGAAHVVRKAMKDFVFADGTHIPAGEQVSFAGFAAHRDAANFDDPNEFKPFRFYDMRKNDTETTGEKYKMTTPSSEYVLFGTGKSTCPGRFFAVNELKTMMAHVLLTYDVKLESGEKPAPFWFGPFILPATEAKVVFRKRILS